MLPSYNRVSGCAAFEATSSASSGHEVLLYKFKEHWQYIDCENFQPASTDDLVEALIASASDDILHFAQVNLEVNQPRE